MIISLLYASAVATFVFALAWIRPPLSTSALTSIVGLFVGFGFVFAILSLMIGFPLGRSASQDVFLQTPSGPIKDFPGSNDALNRRHQPSAPYPKMPEGRNVVRVPLDES